MGDLDRMTVGELKRALESRGIDYRDCVEKRDLVGRLAEDIRAEDERGVSGMSRPVALTAPERELVALFRRCSPSVAFIQTTAEAPQAELSLNAEKRPEGTGSG